jgi:hypothetical protein
MLVLRSVQLRQMEELSRRSFERRLARHLEESFPEECARLGDDEVRRMCSQGVDRAQSHGFRSERDICKFLNLIVVFGFEFDRELPWAVEILAVDDPSPERMERLYAAALEAAEIADQGILGGG